MPLINFKTDFTSLRYGSDKPNGGSSTQPYVQFPIPGAYNQPFTNDQLQFFNAYYETNRTSLDFPIRGGKVTEVAGNTYTTPSNAIDLTRIKNFLEDKPRGTTFIQKQKGLQLTNPRTQVPNAITNTNGVLGLFNPDNQVIPITQTYSPANTLAQVAAQGTGAHFNRQGVSPTLYESPQTTYAYIAANTNNPSENRLLLLSTLKLNSDAGFQFGTSDLIGLQSANNLGISPVSSQILNYTGGPGSVYGIGNTIIKRASSTIPAKAYSKIGLTYDQIAAQNTRNDTDNPLIAQTQDFRRYLVDSKGNSSVAVSNYSSYSQETRLNVGNPGTNTFKRITYTDVIPQAVDKLNAKNLFYFNSTQQTPWNAGGTDTKDIIKFAFECMSNNYAGDAVALVFRAFLDGAIQDTNTAAYNSFKYLGRGETFRVYQGFDRSVSFAFKILVQTRSEMRPLYKKLNHLISQVYPDYSPVQNFMRGSVVKLTIGDYLYRVPGFLENVNVSLATDVGWEILLNEYTENDVAQLPFVVDVSCTFRPILNILPERETYESPYVPLIANGGFMNTGIENPNASSTNKALALAAQENAVAQAAINTNPISPTQPVVAKTVASNSTQPAAVKPVTQGVSNNIPKQNGKYVPIHRPYIITDTNSLITKR